MTPYGSQPFPFDYALLGGSFDPVHNGHLHLAREIMALGLAAQVAFLPVNRHNFKHQTCVLDYPTRYRLIALTLEEGMLLWDDDAEGSGYTSDLMRRIYARYPGKRFAFVIGADNLSTLPDWHEADWLRENVDFLVLPRPGYPMDQHINSGFRLHLADIATTPESSTLIRERIARGEDARDMLPESIAGLVHHLYKRKTQP